MPGGVWVGGGSTTLDVAVNENKNDITRQPIFVGMERAYSIQTVVVTQRYPLYNQGVSHPFSSSSLPYYHSDAAHVGCCRP